MVLGQGENHAYIYTRDGRTRLVDLGKLCKVRELSYARGLSAVTEGEVTVPLNAKTRPMLDGLGTWGYSLVMFRDNDRVWEGPIRRLTHGRGASTISAYDVLGWLERRRIRASRAGTFNAVSEAVLAITSALTPDDPNILAHLTSIAGGGSVLREVAINGGTTLDDLGTLAGFGVQFTTVGRRIIVFPDSATTGRTAQLDLDTFVAGELDVIEDGDLATTAATARDDQGSSITVGGTDSFYGLLDTITSVGSGASNSASLTVHATRTRNQTYPAPMTINIPDGAALSPDAPVEFSQLVAGAVVPVVTYATAKRVKGTSILRGAQISQDKDGEQVQVTLGPASAAAVA